MHLEEIELYGFKTSVSNTKIILSKNITCIVEPNSSGKSNIVDAMRWILGETRLTLLRASKNSDLIFSRQNNFNLRIPSEISIKEKIENTASQKYAKLTMLILVVIPKRKWTIWNPRLHQSACMHGKKPVLPVRLSQTSWKAPEGFRIIVRQIKVSASARYVVPRPDP
jgi:predicted ATP-dependent endonuclease of OLD family